MKIIRKRPGYLTQYDLLAKIKKKRNKFTVFTACLLSCLREDKKNGSKRRLSVKNFVKYHSTHKLRSYTSASVWPAKLVNGHFWTFFNVEIQVMYIFQLLSSFVSSALLYFENVKVHFIALNGFHQHLCMLLCSRTRFIFV